MLTGKRKLPLQRFPFTIYLLVFFSLYVSGSVAEWLRAGLSCRRAWIQIATDKLFTPIVPLFTMQRNW